MIFIFDLNIAHWALFNFISIFLYAMKVFIILQCFFLTLPNFETFATVFWDKNEFQNVFWL